jgi:hypothetical protein
MLILLLQSFLRTIKTRQNLMGISITINNQINADKVEREIESRALIYSSEDIYWRLSVIS